MSRHGFRGLACNWLLLSTVVFWSNVGLAATPGVISARIIARQFSEQDQKLTHVVIETTTSSEFKVSVAAAAEPVMRKLDAGRALEVTVNDVNEPTTITKVGNVSLYIRGEARLTALMISFVVLLLAALGVTEGNPLKFLIGVDERYSNSQTQIVLWFGALATVYLAKKVHRILSNEAVESSLEGRCVELILSGGQFDDAEADTGKKCTTLCFA